MKIKTRMNMFKTVGLGVLLSLFLFSCNPCRNGKSCHRAGDRVKKQQSKASQNRQRYQNSAGGFTL